MNIHFSTNSSCHPTAAQNKNRMPLWLLLSVLMITLQALFLNTCFADCISPHFPNASPIYVVEGKTVSVSALANCVISSSCGGGCSTPASEALFIFHSSVAPFPPTVYADWQVGYWNTTVYSAPTYPSIGSSVSFSVASFNISGDQGNRRGIISFSGSFIPNGANWIMQKDIYVLENSRFQVGVISTNSQVQEGGSSAFRFYRTTHSTSGDDLPVKLAFAISGSAALGGDYSSSVLASGNVTIPINSNYVDVTVSSLSDNILEGAESLTVTLNTDGFGFVTGQQSATMVILDDYPKISLQASDRYADESGSNKGTVTITRTGGVNQPVTVHLHVSGSAIPGVDYPAIPTNIVLVAGVVQSNLTVAPIADGITESAKTVVVSLKTNVSYVSGLYTNAVVTLAEEGVAPRTSYPGGERYKRGAGTNDHYYSMVIPLDGLKGARRADVDASSAEETRYHYDGASAADQSYSSNRIAFNTPIASFGSDWGTPLYSGQSYSIGSYCGIQSTNPVIIEVHRRSDGVLLTNLNIDFPRAWNTNDWTTFTTNGYSRSVSGYGLTTVLRKSIYTTWGTGVGGFMLTHTATDDATNYLYLVKAAGSMNGFGFVQGATNEWLYGYMYDLTFGQRPPWRSVFVDQPHFQTDPLPPDLWGKTPDELLNFGAAVTNSVALSPVTCTNLDQSPELRQHPILDQFVSDMNNDPIALANYVQNEIGLTDAVAYRDDGFVASESINEGGVNRGALGVYLEGQGSPVEQCALLIYMLRRAGYPATYIFPPDGGLKLLDTRLSALLRMRINDAQDDAGDTFTTNRLIAVNYPWVAAYVNGAWVHLFPWIKDTQVEEGLNLYDYMPNPYKDSQLWVRDYILGKSNIMAFATPTDDTPRTIFPAFLDNALKQDAPGISVDDIGMRYVNRRHLYSQWTDFPRPTWVTNTSTAVESLTADVITNSFPALTNIFDTVQVELFSVNNPQKKVATTELRMADLHNRKFFILHTNLGNNQFQAQLSLGAYRPGSTSVGSFSASDWMLTNKQMLTLTLDSTDDDLKIRMRCRRQRALSWDIGIDEYRAFLNLGVAREVLTERPLRKGDVAGICINMGRVTLPMLRVHEQELWNMEQKLSTNSSVANSISPDVYQGTLVYLVGMDYYWRTVRFYDLASQLYKVSDLSHMAMGLAFLSPHRNANDSIFLTNNFIDPIWPKVDMYFQETARAGNGSVRLDSGRDWGLATRDCANIQMADLSAQEHATLDRFFGRSNSVSTVKLLQLAQAKVATGGSNVVELNYYNYAAQGNIVYNGKALKDHDPALWSSVVNLLLQDQGHAVAWVPPGNQTTASGSFSGMGALVLGISYQAAMIGNNLNGAFADPLVAGAVTPGNLPQVEVREDANEGVSTTTTEPTPGTRQAAPETTTTMDIIMANLQMDGLVYGNPEQNLGISTLDGLYFNSDNLQMFEQLNVDGGFIDSSTRNPDGNGVLSWIADPVNSLTGEFYVDAVDMTLPGPMPLQIRRNYNSQNLVGNELGFGWKLNYMPFLSVAYISNIVYVAEPDGAMLAFGSIGTNLWAPTAALNPMLNNYSANGIGSVANAFNARLAKAVTGSVTNYYLTNGDGSLRVFEVMKFPLTNSASWDRLRPYLTHWYDNQSNYYRFEYGTNAAQSDYGEVRRIVSSSGNIIRFLYDAYARVVEAHSLDGRRVQYEYDSHGDLIRVTRPDASEFSFEYQIKTWTTNSLTSAYSTHLLVKELKPDGRVLKNEFDDKRRVTNQWATVGPDLRLVRNATFIYSNNFNLTNLTANLTGSTTVLDYTNNPTTYFYTNNLIRKVRDPFGAELVQEWFEALETNAPAYSRSLKTVTDKRGLVTSFLYDSRGNVTNTTVRGDLLGDGNTNTTAVSTALFNANNLPTLTVDASGNTNLFFYTNTWLLARVESWPSNATPAQSVTSLFSYASVTNADGTAAYGVRVSEVRAANSPDATTNELGFNSRGFPIQMTRFTSSGDPAVTVSNLYNTRGELAVQTDAAGRSTRFGYDPHGSLQSREVFEAGQSVPMAWDFSYYNENAELVWSDGPRYNPEDYVWRDYDGAGRKSQEIRWRSRAKTDGSGVEAETGDNLYSTSFLHYDAFGNLIKATDPRGNYALKRYDAVGQLLREEAYDASGVLLSTNGFAYNLAGDVTNIFNTLGGATAKQYTSTGKPKYQKNPDGSTFQWTFYPDGRLKREFLPNGTYWETTYDDANRLVKRTFSADSLNTETKVFGRRGNLIITTNAEGAVFTSSYDGLNRLKTATGPATISGVSTQQVTTYFYDASGSALVVSNALGEKVVTTYDALKRPVTAAVLAANGAAVSTNRTFYSPDHHSVTAVSGSGANTISNTAFTDTFGKGVLAQHFPGLGVMQFSRNSYDSAANPVASRDELGLTTSFAYDGLNRAATNTLPDGAQISFQYNASGSLTNRSMPGGLVWSATYDNANRMLTERDTGGALTARITIYDYFANGPFVGLLQRVTDARGVVTTNAYDNLLRVTRTDSSGPLSEHGLHRVYGYDRRNLLITLDQYADSASVMLPTAIQRGYDGYGQIISEAVDINGVPETSLLQKWDAAGRRSQFARANVIASQGINAGATTGFDYRANGQMTSVTANGQTYSFGYNNNGLLASRTNPFRTVTVNQRDGRGRLKQQTTIVGATTPLIENLSWRANSTLDDYTAARTGFTDTQDYTYNSRGQLTNSTLVPSAAVASVNTSYGYDANKLGVLTAAMQTGGMTNGWRAGPLDGLSRAQTGTNSNSRMSLRATGMAFGAASVTATLDGNSVSVNYTNAGDGRWTSDLDLGTGPHTLAATAHHPSGLFHPSATNSFRVPSQLTITDGYDAAGNVISRVFSNGRVQTLNWDALGRLIKVTQVNGAATNYVWTALYDGLGRRVRMVNKPGGTNSPASLTVDSWYDPLVEFLEVAVEVNGQRMWKVHGPDISGGYGGMQGAGGLEATVRESDGQTLGLLNDYSGHSLGTFNAPLSVINWSPARVNGYGPVKGIQAPTISWSVGPAEAAVWRGQRIDPTELYCLGTRYYDPAGGRFLSADPLGHAANMDLYSFCGGDPNNWFDPDGRLATSLIGSFLEAGDEIEWNMRQEATMPPTVPTTATGEPESFGDEAFKWSLDTADRLLISGSGGGVGDPGLPGLIWLLGLYPGRVQALPASSGQILGPAGPGQFVLHSGQGSLVRAGVLRTGGELNRLFDSRWQLGHPFSQPMGGSFSPGSVLPTSASQGIIDRGLTWPGVVNNAGMGVIYGAGQNLPVTVRTSLGGTAPEVLIAPPYRSSLQQVGGFVPIGP